MPEKPQINKLTFKGNAVIFITVIKTKQSKQPTKEFKASFNTVFCFSFKKKENRNNSNRPIK